MHAALRPYVTTGVALVGASVIAVSPIAAPSPDIQIPKASDLVAQVELTAFVNPIATLFQVIQTSVVNLTETGGQVLADPLPVLRQLGANGFGYFDTLATAGVNLFGALNDVATTQLPPALQTALGQLRAGNITGAVSTVNDFLTVAGLTLLEPLIPVFGIPSQMAQNLLNVTNLLSTGFSIPLTLGLSVLSTVEGTLTQFGLSAQGVVDGIRGGDPVSALSAALNAPIEIVGAFLNGVPTAGNVGILSPDLGLVNVLTVQIPRMIATALGATPPPPAPVMAKQDSPAALLSATSDLVTVSTPAAAGDPVDVDPVDKKVDSSDTTTTTTTAKVTVTTGSGSAKTKPGAKKGAAAADADGTTTAAAADDTSTKTATSNTDSPKKKTAKKSTSAGDGDSAEGDDSAK